MGSGTGRKEGKGGRKERREERRKGQEREGGRGGRKEGEEMNLSLSLTSHARINSKEITDFNVKCKRGRRWEGRREIGMTIRITDILTVSLSKS